MNVGEDGIFVSPVTNKEGSSQPWSMQQEWVRSIHLYDMFRNYVTSSYFIKPIIKIMSDFPKNGWLSTGCATIAE